MTATKKLYTIGDVARHFGVTNQTVTSAFSRSSVQPPAPTYEAGRFGPNASAMQLWTEAGYHRVVKWYAGVSGLPVEGLRR